MQDPKQDPTFEEETQGQDEQQKLMAMVDNMAAPTKVDIRVGAKVSGTVSRVGDDMVNVDLDGKSTAIMKAAELTGKDGEVTVKVGDTVDAYIANIEDDTITLSKVLSGAGSSSKAELRAAMEEKLPLQGKVTGINKGGLQVKVMGVAGFCPASQVEMKYVEDLNGYLGRSMSFVVTRMEGKRVVLSRIPLLEAEALDKLDELVAAADGKTVRTGTIARIADFGLFIDTGCGVDGLAHISEVSWSRTDNLKDLFSVGQEVSYVVLKVDRQEPLRNTKISLSLKHAEADPWTTVAGKFAVGSQVTGTITRCAPFGAFVQLTPGVEGLIHLSELSWDANVRKAEDVVSRGQEVTVTILSVDESARKIGCTLKDVDSDPWQGIQEQFPVGSSVTGTVASQQKYGYFVDIAPGVTGLLAIPNIASDKRSSIKVGEPLEVQIGGVDTERRRISLLYGVYASEADDTEAKKYMEQAQPAAQQTSEFGEALRAALRAKK